MEPVRLQKLLAQAGFGSRRSCETFIVEGRVTVDGVVVRQLGSKADPETQTVEFDGQKVAGPGKLSKTIRDAEEKVYYMLNKPRGVLCTNEDPSGRPLAIQMIPERRRIFCVGRLDLDTEGLVLLTNDGELTNQLTHPRYGVEKTYVAKVDGEVGRDQIRKLESGVHLAEGRTQGARLRVRRAGDRASTVEMTISEGMNRQVRRMLARVDLRCRLLRRVAIGPIRLGDLPVGESRRLSPEELNRLKAAISHAQQESKQEKKRKKFEAPKGKSRRDEEFEPARDRDREEPELDEEEEELEEERADEQVPVAVVDDPDETAELSVDAEEEESDLDDTAELSVEAEKKEKSEDETAEASTEEEGDEEEEDEEEDEAELEESADEEGVEDLDRLDADKPPVPAHQTRDRGGETEVADDETEEEDKPPRRDRSRDEKPWQKKREGGGRPFEQRGGRDRGERGDRGDRGDRGERKPWQKKSFDSRPRRDDDRGASKPWEKRDRGGAGRAGGKPWEKREGEGRRERTWGEKKPYGDKKPYGSKSFGEKKSYGSKPYGEKRSYGSKPYGEKKSYGSKPYGEKKSYGSKPYGDKKPYGSKPYGEKKSYGDKPFGAKKFGDKKPWDRGGERRGSGGAGAKPWQSRERSDERGQSRDRGDRGERRERPEGRGPAKPWQRSERGERSGRPEHSGPARPWEKRRDSGERGGDRERGGGERSGGERHYGGEKREFKPRDKFSRGKPRGDSESHGRPNTRPWER